MMPKSSSTEEHGGFADWLVYEKKIVSVTVETGTVPCPLPHSQYKRFINETKRCFAGLCYLIKQVIGYEKEGALKWNEREDCG